MNSGSRATYDVLVIGGGVQGLWLARAAVRAGLKCALVEARRCARGASGGLLGALMPHMPTGWSEKKQFQFDALVSLADEITHRSRSIREAIAIHALVNATYFASQFA